MDLELITLRLCITFSDPQLRARVEVPGAAAAESHRQPAGRILRAQDAPERTEEGGPESQGVYSTLSGQAFKLPALSVLLCGEYSVFFFFMR